MIAQINIRVNFAIISPNENTKIEIMFGSSVEIILSDNHVSIICIAMSINREAESNDRNLGR